MAANNQPNPWAYTGGNAPGPAPGAVPNVAPQAAPVAQAAMPRLHGFHIAVGGAGGGGAGGPGDNYDDYEDDELGPTLDDSSIQLKIHIPIVVEGDGNLISLCTTKASDRVAEGIIHAFKRLGPNNQVPMVDSNGAPRPIKLSVNCEVRVNGSRNVVGEEHVLQALKGRVLREALEKNPLKAKFGSADAFGPEDGATVDGKKGEKREREVEEDEGEDSDEVESKRSRHQ